MSSTSAEGALVEPGEPQVAVIAFARASTLAQPVRRLHLSVRAIQEWGASGEMRRDLLPLSAPGCLTTRNPLEHYQVGRQPGGTQFC